MFTTTDESRVQALKMYHTLEIIISRSRGEIWNRNQGVASAAAGSKRREATTLLGGGKTKEAKNASDPELEKALALSRGFPARRWAGLHS